MTVFRTCYGCLHQGNPCEARDRFRNSIRGMHITSVKWKCLDRKNRFIPGDPVWLYTMYNRNGDGDEDGPFRDFFPGHVIRNSGLKAMVYIRPGVLGRDEPHEEYGFVSTSNGFCKVTITRLTIRDGERSPLCKWCEFPQEFGHMDGYPCGRPVEPEILF